MAFQVRTTAAAKQAYDKLATSVRKVVDVKLGLLSADPEARTKLFTQGLRYMDGTGLADDGKLYYVATHFSYNPGDAAIWVTNLRAFEIQGMH